jgi:soluble lytic murein transglycosylase-like protein
MRRTVLLLLSGLSFGCAVPGPSFAEPSAITRLSQSFPYAEHIAEAAQRFELPVAWIRAILAAESNGNPRATSPKGAMGLMQLMPETWANLRARHRLGSNPYDPHDNIIAGSAYIRALFDRYGSPGWIAAYNAGPGRYEASLKGRLLPAETRAYVATVAPNIDNGGVRGAATIAAFNPFAWTRSPLFIAQPDRTMAPDPKSAERPSNDAVSTPTVRDVSAIVPQSNGLFVTRTSAAMVR